MANKFEQVWIPGTLKKYSVKIVEKLIMWIALLFLFWILQDQAFSTNFNRIGFKNGHDCSWVNESIQEKPCSISR